MRDGDDEDILHLTSLKEVFGGFAHEIAQPLNAVMIASQVIQLKIQQSLLAEGEKAYMVQRLNLISAQVKRATEIVESLRGFSRADRSVKQETDLRAVFEKVIGLMGQQFIGRGIDLKWDASPSLPMTFGNPHIIEGVVVQALAYARDAVETAGARHERQNAAYRKSLRVELLDLNGTSCMEMSWERGELPDGTFPGVPNAGRGFAAADSILASYGGTAAVSENSLRIVFGK